MPRLPENYRGETKVLHGQQVPANVTEGKWVLDTGTGKWRFTAADGMTAVNGWKLIYRSDSSTEMPYRDAVQLVRV